LSKDKEEEGAPNAKKKCITNITALPFTHSKGVDVQVNPTATENVINSKVISREFIKEGKNEESKKKEPRKRRRENTSDENITSTEVQCYYCSDMMTLGNIKRHIEDMHGTFSETMYGPSRNYQCQICKGAFETFSKLDRHKCDAPNVITDVVYQCSECPAKFRGSLKLLARHILLFHTTNKSFNCEKCFFKAKTASELAKHFNESHKADKSPNRKKILYCDKCDFQVQYVFLH
jgi:hypothetical protein